MLAVIKLVIAHIEVMVNIPITPHNIFCLLPSFTSPAAEKTYSASPQKNTSNAALTSMGTSVFRKAVIFPTSPLKSVACALVINGKNSRARTIILSIFFILASEIIYRTFENYRNKPSSENDSGTNNSIESSFLSGLDFSSIASRSYKKKSSIDDKKYYDWN